MVIGFRDEGFENQPLGIDDDMAFTTFDFLATVIAP
jgi:hypothetical protein